MSLSIDEILIRADDLKQRGKLYKAITLYETLYNEVMDENLLYWLRLTLADLYFWIKDFDRAEKFILENIESNPNDSFNYYYMGFIMVGRGDLNKAREYFEISLRLDPDNSEYLRGLAWVEFLKGNYEEAENLFREVLSKDPENSAALDNLIELLIKTEKLEEAKLEIEKFRERDPKDWQIIYRIQELKNKQKELRETEGNYEIPSVSLFFCRNLSISLPSRVSFSINTLDNSFNISS